MQIGKLVDEDATYFAAQFHTNNSFLWKVIFYTKPAKNTYSMIVVSKGNLTSWSRGGPF